MCRQYFALCRKTAHVVNLAGRHFLEQGILSVGTMLGNVTTQLPFVPRMQDPEGERRDCLVDWISGPFQDNRKAERSNHLWDLLQTRQLELLRARHTELDREIQIDTLIKC